MATASTVLALTKRTLSGSVSPRPGGFRAEGVTGDKEECSCNRGSVLQEDITALNVCAASSDPGGLCEWQWRGTGPGPGRSHTEQPKRRSEQGRWHSAHSEES